MTKKSNSKQSPSAISTVTTPSAAYKIKKRYPDATDIVIENSNAANRGAISQNVRAPEGDNPGMEDHIDDREDSDNVEELRVNTTRRSRPYTDDPDEGS